MKPPAGKPRARRPVQKKPVQLNLQRTPVWPEENDLQERPDGHFWRWFALVFFLHILVFIVLLFVYHGRPVPQPEFMSLLPPGDTVKGTPGVQAAHKLAPTLPAPSHANATPPPVAPPKPKIHPPTPKPPPIIRDDALAPAPPVKPKPVPPAKPKVKVDLSQLVDAPDDHPPPPKLKPKLHPRKMVRPPDESPESAADSDTQGLSRDEVATKLGDKLKASGVEQSNKTGADGSTHSKANDFADFYQSIHDQVMSKWTVPNLVDQTATNPVVQIHVDKDGRVPPDRVTLLRSSNNPAFDQSALEAARGMGYTLQPLPDGCQPDISITFDLRQQ